MQDSVSYDNLVLLNKELELENKIIEDKILMLKKDNIFFHNENQRLVQELESIKNSRSYKIISKFKKIIRRK